MIRPVTEVSIPVGTYSDPFDRIDRVQSYVQSIGLYFNTEVREIAQQSNGEVIVPQGCIKADPTDRLYNLTLRGRKMYDLDTGSYEIGQDVRLKMIFKLDLENMPLSAQEYIRAKAVFEFYLNEDGADPKLSNYRNERDLGWQFLYREHIRNRQQNIFDNQSNAVTALRRGARSLRWKPMVN